MIDHILRCIQLLSTFLSIVTALLVIIKPFRDRLFGTKQYKDGMRCLLRGEMLHIYYRNKETGKIRQYEFEDFVFCYNAYKSLNGNSFIDKIYNEIKEMEVIS